MRQDMIVIFPLLLAAVRVDLLRKGTRRTAIVGCASAILGLAALAGYRDVASGRFSLSTPHAGVTVLGGYVPGSSLHGWVAPYAFLAETHPEVLRDHQALMSKTSGIAVQEALRRPRYHALRILSMLGEYAIDGESEDPLRGGLEAEEVLPPAIHPAAEKLAEDLRPLLAIEMALIQGFFAAAVLVGIRRRNWAILALASAALLKYLLHAMIVFYGRYFMPATALEILAIAVAIEAVLTTPRRESKSLIAGGLAAGIAVVAMLLATRPLLAYVQSLDTDPGQHTYSYFLDTPDHRARLECVQKQGILAGHTPGLDATLRTLGGGDPAPGDRAAADCVLTGSSQSIPVDLQIFDPSSSGGHGGNMAQRVTVDGEQVYYRNLGADPGGGWFLVPLGYAGPDTRRPVVIEVDALQPEPGTDWAYNSRTLFQLLPGDKITDLAKGRPASQSSSLNISAGGAMKATDGIVDGDFYHDSVTSTGSDDHAWWQVDLGTPKTIGSIVVWNRADCCSSRLNDYWVFLSEVPFRDGDTPQTLQNRPATWGVHQTSTPSPSLRIPTPGIRGRYLRIQLSGAGYLSLAEVQVFGP
jgi:hypothetical protein